MARFNRQYDPERGIEVEPGGGPVLVEVDQAYETTAHLVGRMLEAGVRLEAARAVGFDFPDGVDPGPQPVELLRAPGVDMADVTALGAAAGARLRVAEAKQAEERRKATAAAAAAERERLKSELRAELAAEAAKAAK